MIFIFSYIVKNVRSSDGFRQYNASIPKFLRNRPLWLVDHVRERMPYAHLHVQDEGDGKFLVQSETSSSKKYAVTFGDEKSLPWCECRDWRRHRLPCKHFCSIFTQIQEWDWDKLSKTYRNNPLFSLDETCLFNEANKINEKDNRHEQDDHKEQDNAFNDIYNDDNNHHKEEIHFKDLPPRKRTINNILLSEARGMLKEMLGWTYLVKDKDNIQRFHSEIHKLHLSLKGLVPSDDGLPIITPALKTESRKSVLLFRRLQKPQFSTRQE